MLVCRGVAGVACGNVPQDEWGLQREQLMSTIREQTKENKLLEQIVSMFLPATELGKVWERATWNEEDGEWVLPAIKPRPGFTQIVKLPGIGRGGALPAAPSPPPPTGGAYVSDGEYPASTASMAAAPAPAQAKEPKRSQKHASAGKSDSASVAGEKEKRHRSRDKSAGAVDDDHAKEEKARRRKERKERERAAAAAASAASGVDEGGASHRAMGGATDRSYVQDNLGIAMAGRQRSSVTPSPTQDEDTCDQREARQRLREAQKARLAERKEKQKREEANLDALLAESPDAAARSRSAVGLADADRDRERAHKKSQHKSRCATSSPLSCVSVPRADGTAGCACCACCVARRRKSTDPDGREGDDGDSIRKDKSKKERKHRDKAAADQNGAIVSSAPASAGPSAAHAAGPQDDVYDDDDDFDSPLIVDAGYSLGRAGTAATTATAKSIKCVGADVLVVLLPSPVVPA